MASKGAKKDFYYYVGTVGVAIVFALVMLYIEGLFPWQKRKEEPAPSGAPIHKATDGKAIPGEYIVITKPETTEAEWADFVSDVKTLFASRDSKGELVRSWTIGIGFRGIQIRTTSAYALGSVASHPVVDFVEENRKRDALICGKETNALWKLQRIQTHPISGMNGEYEWSVGSTADIDAYIIDTGIHASHQEFEDRVIWGANFSGDGQDTDCNGHGTHVAGIVGGRTVGVAKDVTLIAVKVLSCDGGGSADGVMSGIEWTVNKAKERGRRAVANMSLGGGYSPAENRAVAAAVDSGIVFAVAAGNENQDACDVSPASEPKAITVGATYYTGSYEQDIRAAFSNWGKCVDVFAPGQGIKSAWIGSNDSYNTISGTSMASPYVCGVAALIRAERPWFSPSDVRSKIISDSTRDAIDLKCDRSGCSRSANKLLYTSRC